MAFESYNDFLSTLEKNGELRRITFPVATELEITEIADREMKIPGGGQALLFEKPPVQGKPADLPLAINTLGSHKRMALALGRDSVQEAAAELGSLMHAKPPTGFREAIQLGNKPVCRRTGYPAMRPFAKHFTHYGRRIAFETI